MLGHKADLMFIGFRRGFEQLAQLQLAVSRTELASSYLDATTIITTTSSDGRQEVEHIRWIMDNGTGADRQLAVWERTQDMKAVVDHIVDETYEGLTCTPDNRQMIA